MSKNLRLDFFRDTATEEEWIQAVDDHYKMDSKEFQEKYGFSWSAIMNEASDRGIYKKKIVRKSSIPYDSASPMPFVITDFHEKKTNFQRSFLIEVSVYERLQKFFADNAQYTNALILSKLVDEALKKYGY